MLNTQICVNYNKCLLIMVHYWILEWCIPWPHLHKPAFVRLLLRIHSFQFVSAFRAVAMPSQPLGSDFRALTTPSQPCPLPSLGHS